MPVIFPKSSELPLFLLQFSPNPVRLKQFFPANLFPVIDCPFPSPSIVDRLGRVMFQRLPPPRRREALPVSQLLPSSLLILCMRFDSALPGVHTTAPISTTGRKITQS